MIRVLTGAIIDVVVDLRTGSPTFGKAFSLELSAENHKQLLVPKGFAHGFSVISPTTEVIYKCDSFYNKEAEAGIAFDDAALNINWQVPANKVIISDKDRMNPLLKNCKNNFVFER